MNQITSQKSKKVFCSSVIHGQHDIRHIVKRVVENELGWKCIMSEYSSPEFSGENALYSCLEAVASSDIFVIIFSKHTGSEVYPFPITFCEYELWRARNNGIPILAYDLGETTRDGNLDYLLMFLKTDPELGIFLRKVNHTKLSKKLYEDLYYLAFNQKRRLRTPVLTYSAKHIYSLKNELSGFGIQTKIKSAYINVIPVDYKELVNVTHKMDTYRQLGCHNKALEVAVPVIVRAFKSISYRTNTTFLYALADLLDNWAGSAAWLGYTRGIFGGLRASRMRFEIYRMLENTVMMRNSLRRMVNLLYVDSSLNITKLHQNRIQSTRQLKYTLNLLKWYFSSSVIRWEHVGDLASVYRALGHYDLAARFFMQDKETNRFNPIQKGVAQVDLGLTWIASGVMKNNKKLQNKGLDEIQQGLYCLKQDKSKGWLLMGKRKYGLAFAMIGNRETALEELQLTHRYCLFKGLWHQAQVCTASIENLSANGTCNFFRNIIG